MGNLFTILHCSRGWKTFDLIHLCEHSSIVKCSICMNSFVQRQIKKNSVLVFQAKCSTILFPYGTEQTFMHVETEKKKIFFSTKRWLKLKNQYLDFVCQTILGIFIQVKYSTMNQNVKISASYLHAVHFLDPIESNFKLIVM